MGKIIGILSSVVVTVLLFALLGSITIISAGERGVVVHLGKVDRVLSEGLYFINPFTNDVEEFEVRTQKEEVQASAASKDLQIVNSVVAVNYNLQPDKTGVLFSSIGRDFKKRVIDPAVQESVKAATAKYTAEELVTKRSLVKDEIKNLLSNRLQQEFIDVTEVSIVNFNFSSSFNQAIEDKVTAEQNALAAKNKLEQVKYEAEQRVAQSRGEAEAIKIQAESISNRGGAEYVRLKSIEKWNGVLPVNLYGSAPVPFINIQSQ